MPLCLNIRLPPAGMLTEALGLGKLFTLRELGPDGGQHGAPVAEVGTRKWGLVAGAEGGAVGRVAGEYVFEASHHSVTERASLKPGVCSRACRTSSETGSSTV